MDEAAFDVFGAHVFDNGRYFVVSYNMMLSCKDVCQDERRAIMDLYQLECFRVVASMQHISNAAMVLQYYAICPE